MTFEERINAVRDQAKTEEETHEEKRTASPSWEDDMFKSGWPNCWGDFNNIMR